MNILYNNKKEMRTLNNIDDFFRFEKESNIFQIKNNNGIYFWDIFRYWVRGQLEYNCDWRNNLPKRNFRLIKLVRSVVLIFKPFFFFYISKKQYDNLFFMASKNRYKGSFIDQNQFDTYQMLSGQRNLIIETLGRQKYKFYNDPLQYYIYIRRIVKLIYHKKISENDCLCVHNIFELLTKNFGELNFSENDLVSLLYEFYLDVYLWNKILKNHKIKRVFLTQNGIQKGFFYVANQLNIPLYEYQHGIIGKAHTAYSYPNIGGIENYIYMPYKFLTLSDYWCKTFYCPMQNQSIGNNYFSKPVEKISNPYKILVISASLFGKQLAEILKKAITVGKLIPSNLIFKLHPNQFSEKDYFINFFDEKVTVLTDEKSVNELLSESRCMITVCSTSAYEALQANTRVLVYTIGMYKEMELLFNDKNLFLFNNIEELDTGLNSEIPSDYKLPIFFEKCTIEKIKNAIDK